MVGHGITKHFCVLDLVVDWHIGDVTASADMKLAM